MKINFPFIFGFFSNRIFRIFITSCFLLLSPILIFFGLLLLIMGIGFWSPLQYVLPASGKFLLPGGAMFLISIIELMKLKGNNVSFLKVLQMCILSIIIVIFSIILPYFIFPGDFSHPFFLRYLFIICPSIPPLMLFGFGRIRRNSVLETSSVAAFFFILGFIAVWYYLF